MPAQREQSGLDRALLLLATNALRCAAATPRRKHCAMCRLPIAQSPVRVNGFCYHVQCAPRRQRYTLMT